MIVANVTKTIEFPHEPGTSAVIRKLSHTQLREAAKKRESEGIGLMREIGAELVKALRDGDGEQLKKLEDAQAKNVNNYDRDLLLTHGLVQWSYDEPIARAGELDEESAAFLAQEIFEFSRRRSEAERKND